MKFKILYFILFAFALNMGCSSQANPYASQAKNGANIDALSNEEFREIVTEGYIYGLPIVMNYAVMYDYSVDSQSEQYKAPFNEIKNEARVYTYKDTAVVSPNSDTPYSLMFMDLRAEPIVLSIPEIEKSRYYSVMLCDGNTFNYGYMGSRATDGEAGDYMVVGPEWKGKTPEKIKKIFRSSTQFSAAVYRTQLFSPEDMPNVAKIQSGYKAQTLSSYLKQPAEKAEKIDFPKIDNELAKAKFFEYLDFALQFAPPGPEEKNIREKLSKIGVGVGKNFNTDHLSPEKRAELELAMKEGEAKIEKYLSEGNTPINGWTISSYFGDRAFYNGDWLKRASAAKAGIYGNDSVEAVYPFTKILENGEILDGSKHKYQLTFKNGEFPPVNAFWSVTIYDAKTQLLIQNPINRYLINSPMLPQLKLNGDGSLTLYIQRDSPGKGLESNWLPAPDGPIYLVMRLYWPKTTPPSILPVGKGNWKPPVIKKTSSL